MLFSILTLKFLALTPEKYDSLPFLMENIPLDVRILREQVDNLSIENLWNRGCWDD